jgi:two-component system, NarL family, nitrate/nitrite response regulator NarL
MTRPLIRILLCDDHPLVLEGIAAVLGTFAHIQVVGAVSSAREALDVAPLRTPDIILMDINMAGLNGLDAIELFREQLPQTKLLMLSMHDSREYISTAVMHGASGYLLKDVSSAELVRAIDLVAEGRTYFSSSATDVLLQESVLAKTVLSSREQSILLLLAAGHTNREVAGKLQISVFTVETHRKNIKRKLGVSSTAGLTQYALRQGILPRGL